MSRTRTPNQARGVHGLPPRSDDPVMPLPKSPSVLLVEGNRASRSLHVWLGPLGLHLHAPDFWKSRPDFCTEWWKRPELDTATTKEED